MNLDCGEDAIGGAEGCTPAPCGEEGPCAIEHCGTINKTPAQKTVFATGRAPRVRLDFAKAALHVGEARKVPVAETLRAAPNPCFSWVLMRLRLQEIEATGREPRVAVHSFGNQALFLAGTTDCRNHPETTEGYG